MATVSELAWASTNRVDFCACCGLRRPLGTLNLTTEFEGESVRCIDCWFGPSDDKPAFRGTAVYIGAVRERCRFGQTGDVLWDGYRNWFEPHGDIESRFEVAILTEIAHLMCYFPERYSVRVDRESEPCY
jgi:hypothetical protein